MKYDINKLVEQCDTNAVDSEESVIWDKMPDVGREIVDDTATDSTEE